MMTKKALIRRSKLPLHIALAAPLFWLIWQLDLAFAGQPHDLGFNPLETANRHTGIWTLRYLVLVLTLTPLQRLARVKFIAAYRRLVGLWAFTYATAHVLSYAWLDHQLDWEAIFDDIADRRYITIGLIAFTLLIPLAATSFRYAMKKLGRSWKKLHQMVYAISLLGVLHYAMIVKGNQLEPLIYGWIVALLLAIRLWTFGRKQLRQQARAEQAQAARHAAKEGHAAGTALSPSGRVSAAGV